MMVDKQAVWPVDRLRRLASWLVSGTAAKQRQREVALLEQSALFDRDWYLQKYADVARSGIEPARHYLESGWREGRDPGPGFSTNAYLRANSDVARAGANPLLHFIEFGYSEGRGTSSHRATMPKPQSPGEPFGDAAPCLSFALAEHPPARWRRASRFDLSSNGLLVVGDLPIGHVPEVAWRGEIETSFASLRQLSGYGGSVSDAAAAESIGVPGCALLDAWYIDQRRLRTRWQSVKHPIVVRAYQHDPYCEGRLTIVSEGISVTSTDFVDVSLCNPYFPLLFVLAELDGTIRAARLLAFPSLCRGGVHYAELLALSHAEGSKLPVSIDIVGHAQALADRLRAIFDVRVAPLVAKLAIDLTGADGTHPLFQHDFRTWLGRVVRIAIDAVGPAQGQLGSDFLATTIELSSSQARSTTGGRLVLAADMIPTISGLSAPACAGGELLRETALSLLVAAPEPSQPATLFSLPPTGAIILQADAPDYPCAWPRLVLDEEGTLPDQLPAAAIRVAAGRELADAELLVPVSQPRLPLGSAVQPITWLIFPEQWQGDTLAQALEALSLQAGAERHAIAFVGDADPSILSLAKRMSRNRVRVWTDSKAVAGGVETPLVGYVGGGVILHDERWSQRLSSLLENPEIATASSVVVNSERRGKTWHVGVADAGRCVGNHGTLPVPSLDAQRLWRSNYPVARPPRDLWIARTRSLVQWIHSSDIPQVGEGLHICTSLVTASYAGRHEKHEPAIVPPPACPDCAMRSQALFG